MNEEPQWVSYHLFYHASGNKLLSKAIFPIFRDLWMGRKASGFFFVRYALGGPHIRLRILCTPDSIDEVDRTVNTQISHFFQRCRSAHSLREDVIRERNRRLSIDESHARVGDKEIVYPDNSIIKIPFEPEVERYGGESLISYSFSFFSLSSAYALHFLDTCGDGIKTSFLAWAMRSLLRQAIGCAADGKELSSLISYACSTQENPSSPLAGSADTEFERQPEAYARLLREEVENWRSRDGRLDLDGYLLAEASRRLSHSIHGASHSARWMILTSQLHMTANRLGVNLVEEAYIGRILWRAARAAQASGPALLKRLPGRRNERRLEDLVALGFDQLFAFKKMEQTA